MHDGVALGLLFLHYLCLQKGDDSEKFGHSCACGEVKATDCEVLRARAEAVSEVLQQTAVRVAKLNANQMQK